MESGREKLINSPEQGLNSKETIQKSEIQDTLYEIQQKLHTLLAKEKDYALRFQLHHKIIFAFLIFFAINLLWYGMWEIVSMLPFVRNPMVAIVIGSIILIGTGCFYENLIANDFDKKQNKKKSIQKPKIFT